MNYLSFPNQYVSIHTCTQTLFFTLCPMGRDAILLFKANSLVHSILASSRTLPHLCFLYSPVFLASFFFLLFNANIFTFFLSFFLFFFLIFGCTTQHVGSQFHDQGSNMCLLQRKRGVLTIGPPGKSPNIFIFSNSFFLCLGK